MISGILKYMFTVTKYKANITMTAVTTENNRDDTGGSEALNAVQ